MNSTLDLLRQLAEEGKKFTVHNYCYSNESGREFGGQDTPEWMAWKSRTRNIVRKNLSDDAPAVRLANTALAIDTHGNYHSEFERAKATLLKCLELAISALTEDAFGELRVAASTTSSPALSNKVFIVHGHDGALKTDVERFVHQIGLEPIVLHRQVDQGQTIIEKFEQHSDVGYALILLTPDEIAYTIDQSDLPDEKRIKEYRARPNVIFEFGYFVGKLGRSRVCCIHKENVVVPSDLSGLIYKKVVDSVEPEAFSIIRELKAAGYQIRL